MSNNKISEETLNKLKELDVKHIHINNGGKELTDEDYLNAITAINEILEKRRKNNINK